MIYNNTVTAEGMTSVFDTKELLRKIVTNAREMAEAAKKTMTALLMPMRLFRIPVCL